VIEHESTPIRDHNPEKLFESNCDGLECSNKASEKLVLRAGKFGTIEVLVCSKCKEIIKRKEEIFSEKASLAHPSSLSSMRDNH
jgi:hypothetical protein